MLATPGYFFQTPSGNFHCAIFDKPIAFTTGYSADLGCQGLVAAVPDGEKPCAKPEQSQALMPAFGLADNGSRFTCTADALFYGTSDSPALPYGQYLKVGSYKCLSQEMGITCSTTDQGASFFVSKESSKLVNSAAGGNGGTDSVSVPDVGGERPAKAAQILQDAGLKYTQIGGSDRGSHGAQCVVVKQAPIAGSQVKAGAEITLTTGEASPNGTPC
ncbi:PASTA domain-containing protein [Nocardia jejuensis]|uniref:PASTA domain-containing protein n=1 Tax=Nocardia jejuensis TaxID=328049 RepID=UPI0012F73E3F|nr:PASTA domain-containing protein [Nocardia jejuensis]